MAENSNSESEEKSVIMNVSPQVPYDKSYKFHLWFHILFRPFLSYVDS